MNFGLHHGEYALNSLATDLGAVGDMYKEDLKT